MIELSPDLEYAVAVGGRRCGPTTGGQYHSEEW